MCTGVLGVKMRIKYAKCVSFDKYESICKYEIRESLGKNEIRFFCLKQTKQNCCLIITTITICPSHIQEVCLNTPLQLEIKVQIKI